MISVHERTAQFLDPTVRRWREIVTPEGVPLRVEVAGYGERAVAFLLDAVILSLASAALFLALALAGHAMGMGSFLALGLLVAFLVRNLYFCGFELAWRGATPGKRIVGLRVIDRHGGPLLPFAVIARNLTRELEAFMPLQALLAVGAPGPGGWQRAALAGWLLVLAAFPLFNRDRLRSGDLIAGTMVISLPKRRLLPDLAVGSPDLGFSDGQLRQYGAFELEVLEEVLRRPAGAETSGLLADVCQRICRRIGWSEPVPAAAAGEFLRQFYAAQRAFLERERLYGRERADKNDPGNNDLGKNDLGKNDLGKNDSG